jgi:hypothetical protein
MFVMHRLMISEHRIHVNYRLKSLSRAEVPCFVSITDWCSSKNHIVFSSVLRRYNAKRDVRVWALHFSYSDRSCRLSGFIVFDTSRRAAQITTTDSMDQRFFQLVKKFPAFYRTLSFIVLSQISPRLSHHSFWKLHFPHISSAKSYVHFP